TDFGLARLADTEQEQTRSGVIMGTPSYMAPEQAEGRTKGVGPAADVYALGAILYECLTGRPPFRAQTTMATLEQVRRQDPVSPSRLVKKVPRDLETICLKCLAKEPQKRYASAAELGADLYRFLEHEPIRARRAGPVERSAKWVKRHAVAVLATLLAILIL